MTVQQETFPVTALEALIVVKNKTQSVTWKVPQLKFLWTK